MARLFTYVIPEDWGFAPNPFFGTLTLNCCKPQVRQQAEVGDWIAANTGADFPGGRGLLVYAARITAKMTMREYDAWTGEYLPEKRPQPRSRFYERRAGDSLYNFDVDPPTRRAGFHHPDDMPRDLSGVYTLLSDRFVYFGRIPVDIPDYLRPIIHTGQAHKSNLNAPYVEHFEEWITSRFLHNKIYGMPAKAPTFQEVEFGSKPSYREAFAKTREKR
jgi:hypothetical protein